MTATRKTTVTHPDNTISTRGSKTRTYAFAVEVAPAPAGAYAAYLIRQAEAVETRIAKFRTAADAAQVQVRSRGFRTVSDYVSHDAVLVGTDREISWYSNGKGEIEDRLTDGHPIVGAVAYLTAYARRYADDLVPHAAKYRAEAADVLATGTPVDSYAVVRWSSSEALAVKALTEFDYLAERGHVVRVVPVDAP